jgi:cyclophilin family peptidyl-prolyl cis-trans isomerase/predicted small lipoprotein YifL
MKRAFAPIALLAVAVTLAACGSDDDDIASPAVVGADSIASTEAPEPDHPTASNAPAASDANAPPASAATGFVFGSMPCPDAEGAELPDVLEPPQKCIEDGRSYAAEVVTNHGSFTIELSADRTPGTVNNFVVLARYGYYDGSSCHRIIADFAIQCGRRGQDEGAPGYRIPDELPAPGEYADGVAAMANTGQPNSGGAQWFIIAGDAGASLPPQYSILGTVSADDAAVAGALEALADAAAQNGVPPLEPVDIESITIIEG